MTATVHLARVTIDTSTQHVRTTMIERFGHGIVRRFNRDLFARHAHVLRTLSRGNRGSLLDVGVGQGIFLNAAAHSGLFSGPLVGIDVTTYKHFVHMGGWQLRELDVVDLDYPDRHFDTVTAMEVIEHLPDGKMEAAVEQIKRVARHRAIVTVPYRQVRLPSYHLQRFDEDRLAGLFPGAKLRILRKQRGGTHWLMADWKPT